MRVHSLGNLTTFLSCHFSIDIHSDSDGIITYFFHDSMMVSIKNIVLGFPCFSAVEFFHIILEMFNCIFHQWDNSNLIAFTMKLNTGCWTNLNFADFCIYDLLYSGTCIIKQNHKKLIPQSYSCPGIRHFQNSFYSKFRHIFNFWKRIIFLNLYRWYFTH